MPIVYFTGGREDEQARGAEMYNGSMQLFAIKRDDPLNLIYLGGHRVDDAPSYNVTEGKISPQYRFINGRNVVVERQISNDVVKSVTLNIIPPNKLISVTDRIYQAQSKCNYDLALVPYDCESGCSEYFLLGEDLKLGAKQISNSPVGYDDNEAPINTTRTAKTSGQLRTYMGLEVRELSAAAVALYAVAVGDDSNTRCAGCGCPYQTIYRAGGDGVAVPLLQKSTDGGATWTTITTTALGAGNIITSLLYVDNRLLIGYSDVADADGTDGGIAYIDSAGTIALSTTSVASTGVQALVKHASKIVAVGTTGQFFVSEDNGFSFTLVTSGITMTILDAEYDKTSGNTFLATEDGQAWVWNGTTFTNITADVAPTAATDLTDVTVTGADQVMFAGADGNVYENFSYSKGGDWSQTASFASAVYSAASDTYNYRNVTASGNTLYRRDLITYQAFEELASVTGDITDGVAGSPLLDEGANFFIFVSDTGETVIVSACGMCI